MFHNPRWGCRVLKGLGCGALLLLCVAPVVADPKPLSKQEQAKVDRAIDKGIAVLKRAQTNGGDWPCLYATETHPHLIGQCALPAYALLEAGVSANDLVIQKAADYLRPRVLADEQTYDLSLALLFFERLGDARDKPLIRSLSLRLIAGQHWTGGWNYRCPNVAKQKEETLFKLLVELNKGLEKKEKSKVQLLRDLRVPTEMRTLAVFRDPRRLPWQDPPDSDENKHSVRLIGTTDNSNTQFAMLGLWVAQRLDIPVGPTFRLMVERFEKTQSVNGWWPYHFDRGPSSDGVSRPSMVGVGLMALAIGRGKKYVASESAQLEKVDIAVLRGLAALSQDMAVAASGTERLATSCRGPYYLWTLERVAMLYDLPTIEDKDWYRWGAGIFVASQRPGGEWRNLALNSKTIPMPYYGPILNTSFALLFLKRSHPMKDLTSKLPLSAKELNAGIARLRSGDVIPQQSTTRSSQNKSSDR